MNLYLVRHAVVCPKNQNRYNGHSDISLCKDGREMAKRLAAELDEMEFDAVFCSDLLRAKETLLPSKHYKSAVYTHLLREKSWGKHEGMSFDEIVASGLEYRDFKSWIDSLDGESVLEFCARVEKFLEDLNHNNILVVTHAGVIATVKSIINNLGTQDGFSEKIEHCEVVKIVYENERKTQRKNMKSYNILTNKEESLPQGNADFLLAASVTRTCDIEGITQAGIPGLIHLTPTLDAEFITNGTIYSLPNLATTPSGVPSPAIITRAVHLLKPFSSLATLDLGLVEKPKNCTLYEFGISPSGSIASGAGIDTKEIFEKGAKFGEEYKLKGDYLILGESTPSGTTTAFASALALGFECEGNFSSSFANVPSNIRNQTVNSALAMLDENMSDFEKLGFVSDNMLLFCAGFISSASKRFLVVLAGGTQMASCLLIADKLTNGVLNHQNLCLATTAWVAKDKNSNIAHLLSLLSFTPSAIYTEFSFQTSRVEILKKYDDGEAKEGVGAGGALAYASDIDNTALLKQIEQ